MTEDSLCLYSNTRRLSLILLNKLNMLSGIISFLDNPEHMYLQSPLKKAPGLKVDFYPSDACPATIYITLYTTGKNTFEQFAVPPKVQFSTINPQKTLTGFLPKALKPHNQNSKRWRKRPFGTHAYSKKGESRHSKSGRQNHCMRATSSKNNFARRGYIAPTATPQDFTPVVLEGAEKTHGSILLSAPCCQLRAENTHISLIALLVGTRAGTGITPCWRKKNHSHENFTE